MDSLHIGRFDGKEMPDRQAGKAKFSRLWQLAERMDWNDRWPRSLWRWLLRKIDEANGHHGLDYDY